MKGKTAYLILFFFAVYYIGCKDTVVSTSTVTDKYNEILSSDFSGINIKMYLLNTDSLTTGYNKVFFKVKKNGAEQNSGAVKFYPKMQMTPHLWHGTPVCTTYTYDNSVGYFSGYVIFTMSSQPPILNWYSTFTYIDANNISYVSDTVLTNVVYHADKQWKIFEDSTTLTKYFLGLVEPYSPAKGLNNFSLVLNKSDDLEQVFSQLTEAQMFLKVYNSDSLNSTTGNVNPVCGSDGIYRGKINLPYAGSWKVCDTLFYNNHYITNNPPPMPEFNFEVQ